MKTPSEVVRSLVIQFGLDDDFKKISPHPEEVNLDEVKAVLAERILYLLRNDHTTLFNILYRIDVKEEQVKNALSANFLQDASSRLADLILERQMQKYINKKAGKL